MSDSSDPSLSARAENMISIVRLTEFNRVKFGIFADLFPELLNLSYLSQSTNVNISRGKTCKWNN